jgi:glutamate--cysteine ligase
VFDLDTIGHDGADAIVRRAEQAEAYIAGICFKTGPPGLVGIELEWTVHHADDPSRSLDPQLLAHALDPHTPPTLDPSGRHQPLPSGNVLTVEPGGQVEISTQPYDSLPRLYETVTADVSHLRNLLTRAGLRLGGDAIDAYRLPRRVLHTPRYDAMAAAFQADGPHGRTMMCSTAALQVCLDAGRPTQLTARWAALHALGPVLLAMFANSRRHAGQDTGWASARMRSWLGMDQARTGPVNGADSDPAASWARYALRAPVLCVRRPGQRWYTPPAGMSLADWIGGALGEPPTFADLEYHLSTLFPPVRPRGYLEVRYLDAQPPDEWIAPVAVLVALLIDDASVDLVRDLCATVASRWHDAARVGLADPGLAAVARQVADLAARQLPRTGLTPVAVAEVNELVGRRLAGGQERSG